MNVVPVSIRSTFWTLLLASGGTLSAVLVADGYTYSAAHDMLADVDSGDRVSITEVDSPTVTNGELFGTITFSAVAAGPTCIAVWLFMDTGTPATSKLVGYIDQYGDRRPISTAPIVPDGNNIALTWPDDLLLGIGTPVTT